MVGLSRSSWYFQGKDSEHDLGRQNSGRPIPGFTVNRDGTIVLDPTISSLLIDYRRQPEYANGGGYRKLTKMLRRDYGIYVNTKKIYRICEETGVLLEQRSKSSRPKRLIARNRVITGPNQLWQLRLVAGWHSLRKNYLMSSFRFGRRIRMHISSLSFPYWNWSFCS